MNDVLSTIYIFFWTHLTNASRSISWCVQAHCCVLSLFVFLVYSFHPNHIGGGQGGEEVPGEPWAPLPGQQDSQGHGAGPQLLPNGGAGLGSSPPRHLGSHKHQTRSDPRMRTKDGHCFPHPSTEQGVQNICSFTKALCP